MFGKKEQKTIQERLNDLGLNDLDADDTEMVTNMLCESFLIDFRNNKTLNWGDTSDSKNAAASLAMYSQNYLFLKHILKLEKQNQEIIKLLTEIRDKQ